MTNDQIFVNVFIPVAAALGGGIVGAIIASKNQKTIIRHNDKKYVLAQLMSNRHEGPTNEDFVKALNMVVVIFHDNKAVKESLRRYHALSMGSVWSGGERITAIYNLMRDMAVDIGFDLNHSDLNDFFVLLPPLPEDPTK